MLPYHDLSQFGVTFFKLHTSNNIPAFLFNRTGMPICIRVVFYAGSRFDEIPGTAHFLEHMLVAGSKKFSSKDKLSRFIEECGGSFSATTDNYSLRIDLTVPDKDDLVKGLSLLQEMLFHSIFDASTIELERGSIIVEIEKRKNNSQVYVNDIYRKLFFQKTIAANSVLGDSVSVMSISKDNLIRHKEKYLTPDRMCIMVSGDVSTQEIEHHLSRYLSYEITHEQNITVSPLPVVYEKKIIAEKYTDGTHSDIIHGFRTASMYEKDSPVLEVIASYLGGGRSSRLVTELRYKKGLVYNVLASNNRFPDGGTFTISTSCDSKNIDKIITIIQSELKYLKEKLIDTKSLESVKSYLIKSQFIKMQTSLSWLQVHEKELLFNHSSPQLLNNFLNNIEAVSTEDIFRVANNYFTDQEFLAIYGLIEKSS